MRQPAHSGGGAAAAASGPLTFELEAEIERLKDELMQTKEQSLRAMAEAQNIRRRAEQDVERPINSAWKSLCQTSYPWRTT